MTNNGQKYAELPKTSVPLNLVDFFFSIK